MVNQVIIGALLLLSLEECLSLGPPPDGVQIDVFTQYEEGYECFRLPALLYTSTGTLLAFAEGRGQRTRSCSDTATDVAVVMKISRDDGTSWSSLSVVHSNSERCSTIGNPCPIEDVATSKLLLLLSCNRRQVLMIESADEGLTWSNPVDITDMIAPSTQIETVFPGGPGGLQLPNGRLILGAYASGEFGPGAFSIYSDDHGKSWKHSQLLGDTSTRECQIAPLGLESKSVRELVMTVRSTLGHFLAYSNDLGETWFNLSIPRTLNPQGDCEGSILSIPYEGVYLDTHLYTTQPHSTYRQNVTFFHSVDGGQTWKADFLLWRGPSAYSSMAYNFNRLKVFCMFECGMITYTEKLTLVIFSPLI